MTAGASSSYWDAAVVTPGFEANARFGARHGSLPRIPGMLVMHVLGLQVSRHVADLGIRIGCPRIRRHQV